MVAFVARFRAVLGETEDTWSAIFQASGGQKAFDRFASMIAEGSFPFEVDEVEIVIDAGGTSFDVSVVRNGRIPRTRETSLHGCHERRDLAVESGGNCALSRPDDTVIANGVTILGPVQLAATVPLRQRAYDVDLARERVGAELLELLAATGTPLVVIVMAIAAGEQIGVVALERIAREAEGREGADDQGQDDAGAGVFIPVQQQVVVVARVGEALPLPVALEDARDQGKHALARKDVPGAGETRDVNARAS